MYMMYFKKHNSEDIDRFVEILMGVLKDMGVGVCKVGVDVVDGRWVYTVYLDGFGYDEYVGRRELGEEVFERLAGECCDLAGVWEVFKDSRVKVVK